MQSYKRYSIYFLLAFAVVWSLLTIAAGVVYYSYPRYMNRVLNVRSVPDYFRMGAVLDFLDAKLAKSENPVLVVGDSQFYGGMQSWRDTFSAFLEQSLHRDVINAAVIDGRVGDVLAILANLPRDHAYSVIYNVNPTHFSSAVDTRRLNDHRAIAPFFLLNPALAFKLLSSIEERSAPEGYRFLKLDSQQYDMEKDGGNIERYRTILRILESMSAESIVVMSPQDISAFRHYGLDNSKILSAKNFLLSICREYRVTCLDLSHDFPHEYFRDIIHLNTVGHKVLAKRLADILRH